ARAANASAAEPRPILAAGPPTRSRARIAASVPIRPTRLMLRDRDPLAEVRTPSGVVISYSFARPYAPCSPTVKKECPAPATLAQSYAKRLTADWGGRR